jgi:hypothetical protein
VFKRGTYQRCSAKYLHRYLAEFDFRPNTALRLALRIPPCRKLSYERRDQSTSMHRDVTECLESEDDLPMPQPLKTLIRGTTFNYIGQLPTHHPQPCTLAMAVIAEWSALDGAVLGLLTTLFPGRAEPIAEYYTSLKGTSNNCHRSSGAPNLPTNDSALFSFRFCAVHPKDLRDSQLRQLFEVPSIRLRRGSMVPHRSRASRTPITIWRSYARRSTISV